MTIELTVIVQRCYKDIVTSQVRSPGQSQVRVRSSQVKVQYDQCQVTSNHIKSRSSQGQGQVKSS